MRSCSKTATTFLKGLIILNLAFLAACGDDDEYSIVGPQTNDKVSSSSQKSSSSSEKRTSVKSSFELGKCSSENKNEQILVSDENVYYTCSYKNGDYTWTKPESAKSSSSRATVSSSSVLDEKLHQSSSSAESNYKNEEESFLYKEFFVEIDLTLFKQVSANWEQLTTNKENYSDGDPRIYFIVKTYSYDNLIDSVKTDVFNPGDNVGKWTGHEYFTKKFSGGVNEVYVCPVVYEYNVIESNVFHSSSYCYIIHDAGDKVDVPILQSDSKATDLKLEWAVTISYK